MVTLTHALEAVKLPRATLIDATHQQLFTALLKRHKVSHDEYERIESSLDRKPTFAELGVFSAMWSEHCSYKSSRVHLSRFPTTGPDVVVGPGENAGVVRLKGKICVAFKMESHNHPSYIEPYQGASTGVGGILRDVFCMGARPFASLNCLRFGRRDHHKTPYLVPRVVKGIGDYGNCVGVPTVGGSISFDESYDGNCLVNAMTAGLIHEDKIFKGLASGVGNLVVYVGSATGRDGINGATMASDEFSAGAPSKTTIQVGDPFAEKLLLEATLEVLAKQLVVGIQDMGAAGLTSSAFEMAGRAGNGVFIDLDRVPMRAKEMTAYEIMLSESQERMLMVVEPNKHKDLKLVLDHWGLANEVIGIVTNSGCIHATRANILEIDLPVAPLTDDAPRYRKPIGQAIHKDAMSEELLSLGQKLGNSAEFLQESLIKCLMDTRHKEPVFCQFDRHVGTSTVLGPEHGGAAVMWIKEGIAEDAPFLGVALDAGCNERRVKNHAHRGACDAVMARARSIAAAGATPLAITDCLNFGSADDPIVMRQLSDAVDGISQACRELDIPVVSGNVSLYNTTNGKSIHPTPMIGMIGRIHDIRACTPAVLSENATSNVQVYLLSPKASRRDRANLAASLVAKVHNIDADCGSIADIFWAEERAALNAVLALRQSQAVKVIRPVADGGLILALFKILGRSVFTAPSIRCHLSLGEDLWAEGGARYLMTVDDDKVQAARHICDEFGLELTSVAEILFDGTGVLQLGSSTMKLDALCAAYYNPQMV